MTVPTGTDVFRARCLRVAAALSSAGLSLRKVDKQHAIEISAAGKSVVFPIVTDERDWKSTTVEEAFYAALVDAKAWSGANVSDITISTLDGDEKTEVPLVKRDLDDELGRVGALAELLGGKDKLTELYKLAELD